MAPWQIWWVNFDPHVGHEQRGQRPAIIVGSLLSCDLPNGLITAVPCTSTDRQLPIHPEVMLGRTRSFAMCDQLKSISTNRLISPHRAKLTEDEIEAIRFVLKQLIDI
ncbi:type II toxin-antitoxin system PemK/MazF family toxin [Natronoglycomyces albus]|uniref:type II toxin-antitoxin system PemK/MazF family toxin n=1 Tax=Natronoglycomyces albus TaxID=2811108 RepID=UPI001FE91BF4|nr:type II toxin-antitoxin system PemK/MazF family toxin [Natronoglycomyces albus]